MSARYLDPAILRLGTMPAPTAFGRPRLTLHVTPPFDRDYEPGERVRTGSSSVDQRFRTLTISTRWVTVVSWDRDSGELVVQPDER